MNKTKGLKTLLMENKRLLTENSQLLALNQEYSNVLTKISNSINILKLNKEETIEDDTNADIQYHKTVRLEDITVIEMMKNIIQQKLMFSTTKSMCSYAESTKTEIILYKCNGKLYLIDNVKCFVALQNKIDVKSTIINTFEGLTEKQKNIVKNNNIKGGD